MIQSYAFQEAQQAAKGINMRRKPILLSRMSWQQRGLDSCLQHLGVCMIIEIIAGSASCIIMGAMLGVDHALAPPSGRQERLRGPPKE